MLTSSFGLVLCLLVNPSLALEQRAHTLRVASAKHQQIPGTETSPRQSTKGLRELLKHAHDLPPAQEQHRPAAPTSLIAQVPVPSQQQSASPQQQYGGQSIVQPGSRPATALPGAQKARAGSSSATLPGSLKKAVAPAAAAVSLPATLPAHSSAATSALAPPAAVGSLSATPAAAAAAGASTASRLAPATAATSPFSPEGSAVSPMAPAAAAAYPSAPPAAGAIPMAPAAVAATAPSAAAAGAAAAVTSSATSPNIAASAIPPTALSAPVASAPVPPSLQPMAPAPVAASSPIYQSGGQSFSNAVAPGNASSNATAGNTTGSSTNKVAGSPAVLGSQSSLETQIWLPVLILVVGAMGLVMLSSWSSGPVGEVREDTPDPDVVEWKLPRNLFGNAILQVTATRTMHRVANEQQLPFRGIMWWRMAVSLLLFLVALLVPFLVVNHYYARVVLEKAGSAVQAASCALPLAQSCSASVPTLGNPTAGAGGQLGLCCTFADVCGPVEPRYICKAPATINGDFGHLLFCSWRNVSERYFNTEDTLDGVWPVLLGIVIFTWLCCLSKAVRETALTFRALSELPVVATAGEQMEQHGKEVILVGLTRGSMLALTLLVVVPKLCLEIFLGYAGSWLLVAAMDTTGLLSSTLVLIFLLSIDGILYYSLTGSVQQQLLESTKAMAMHPGWCFTSGSKSASSITSVALDIPTCLVPLAISLAVLAFFFFWGDLAQARTFVLQACAPS